ncbi:hypothetical protein QP363_12650, partial [Corynebacterium sp. UMB6689]|nr:hypothetical protein [Corynebacterium sp. UMB6689]
SLASVIGEEELSDLDKKYLAFGEAFEQEFIGQKQDENRTITDTLNLGWDLLRSFPRTELNRMDSQLLDKYYEDTTYSYKKDALDKDSKQDGED